jgi:hypothetical protein
MGIPMSGKLAEMMDMEVAKSQLMPREEFLPLPEDVSEETKEDEDFAIARRNTIDILDSFNAAIQTAMVVAAESQNPRAIEVLSGLLKNAADANKQLIQLNKEKIEVKNIKKGHGQQTPQIGTQQNVIFTGSGAELNKLLKEKLIEGK